MTEVNSRSRTEDLVDRWAHDAEIVSKDEHVKGRAGLRSMAEAWKDRNEGSVGEAAEHTAKGVAKESLVEVADHFLLEHGGKAAAAGARVNVALAQSLDFHKDFGTKEAVERPGVEHGAARLKEQLAGKDAVLEPILQNRADEGFDAAERAWNATANVPRGKRAEAMQQWMKDNGFEDRRRNDVAFGKGVEYLVWCKTEGGSHGVSCDAESKKVHARLVPPQPFVQRG